MLLLHLLSVLALVTTESGLFASHSKQAAGLRHATESVVGTCDANDPAACFGNGVCTAARTCACDSGWKSAECDVLALGVSGLDAGYRNASNPVWGGTVVQHNGQYHMFMGGKKVSTARSATSKTTRAVRAVGSAPDGPFRYVEEVTATPPASLGPGGIGLRVDVHRTPNGSLALFTAAALDGKFGLVLLVSPLGDPAGPWYGSLLFHVRINASARWDCGQINDPSASIAADGSLLVVFRSLYGCGGTKLERIGLLHAPHWTSALSRVTSDASSPLFGFLVSNEDPYIWRSKRGVHMLMHTQGGVDGPWPDRKTRGAVAFAPGDGTNISAWRVSSKEAWSASVVWVNGSATQALRRQRPALVFNAAGAPTHLITGVNFASSDWHATNADWTLITPLEH